VASVDRQTGAVKAGRGNQERTYALAVLSVGRKAASYPLVFEPRRSFRPKPLPIDVPALPIHVAASSTPPQPIVLGTTPASLPPQPPPPSQVTPTAGALSLPAPPPAPPGVGPLTPAPLTPPTPPAPPAPPPASPVGAPLALNAALSNVTIQATVLPPTPPPVNPAPPGGSAARKEAKQRQAATAKSESSGDGAPEATENGGDEASSPPGWGGSSSATRADPHPFTAVRHGEQASAWVRGAEWGGVLGGSSIVLALLWSVAGPTARRRERQRPAPAWSRSDRR
jgi:hypothetical protein